MLEILMALALTSSAFNHDGPIPKLHTCQGKYISAPLAWTGLPAGTKKVCLIVDDRTCPGARCPGPWVLHAEHGTEQAVAKRDLPPGTLEGLNDWGRTGYGGPCPPIGRHRYFHKLYALDTVLPDLHQPSKAQLETAMKGHVIEKFELIGTYKKD
jgi:Raf kinase inhibitor-like YbhB/YbcL family protein